MRVVRWSCYEAKYGFSVLSVGKTARIFRSFLTFGKLSACVRRPRWIYNPTLPVDFSGSSIETVHFRKMTAMASDGPTSHTVLQQVLLWLLQT